MDNKVLELCKNVLDSNLNALELHGVECGDIYCHECPFWWKNRDDNMDCCESMNKTREIARRYIEDNVNNPLA